jgi:hypothetical protein
MLAQDRQSCGGPCTALRNPPNCFISWTTVRWARGLLPHEVSHLSVSHSVMLVLFGYFQLCRDQNFPPFAADGTQPFIVHTWQTKACCFVIMQRLLLIAFRIIPKDDRKIVTVVRSVFRSRAVALRRYFRVSHLCGTQTLARCRVHTNPPLVHALSDVNTAHACLPHSRGGC